MSCFHTWRPFNQDEIQCFHCGIRVELNVFKLWGFDLHNTAIATTNGFVDNLPRDQVMCKDGRKLSVNCSNCNRTFPGYPSLPQTGQGPLSSPPTHCVHGVPLSVGHLCHACMAPKPAIGPVCSHGIPGHSYCPACASTGISSTTRSQKVPQCSTHRPSDTCGICAPGLTQMACSIHGYYTGSYCPGCRGPQVAICECGSEKVGSGGHSTWCPKFS